VSLGEGQNDIAWRNSDCFPSNQARPLFGKLAAKHASYVEQRVAAADQAGIVGAVAKDVAFDAQDSILQRDGIQTPRLLPRTCDTKTLHPGTSSKQ